MEFEKKLLQKKSHSEEKMKNNRKVKRTFEKKSNFRKQTEPFIVRRRRRLLD